jgi:Cysteine rich repeat
MHTPRSTVTGRLLGLLVISLSLVSPAVAQKPSRAQVNAVRQACRADYQTYCSTVPTGGSASLACLERNAQSLSEPCRQAVAAIGQSGGSAEPETRHCTNGTGSHHARPPSVASGTRRVALFAIVTSTCDVVRSRSA